ncbi:hypothetical protein BJX68DRAFT_271012 [Aspergillus pseudodeflectus]|uniref:RiboL-PSP-HEPN domain-containing protein n=1 Tax=Aspergillus pseudodeflectus TaxID=176178 RepID=A0ABR4JP59_9EURO
MDGLCTRSSSHAQPHTFHPDRSQQPAPVLPRKRPIFQAGTSAGSDAIYKLLAKNPCDQDKIYSNRDTNAPSAADHPATAGTDEDPLVVLGDLIANGGQPGTECQLDNRHKDALRTAVDGIRRLRLLLCIGDYTQKVSHCIRDVYNPGMREPSVDWLCEHLSSESLAHCLKYVNDIYPGMNISPNVVSLSLQLYRERNAMVHSGMGAARGKHNNWALEEIIAKDRDRLKEFVRDETPEMQEVLDRIMRVASRLTTGPGHTGANSGKIPRI